MFQKKILLLSPFFYPEPISTGKYNTYLAKELCKKGFDVEVITSVPIYPEWRPKKTKKSLNRVKIIRGGHWVPYPKSIIFRRLVLEIWFSFHVFITCLRRFKKDVVIPIFPPILFFLFVQLIFPKSTKRIGIVHDLQAVMANVSNRHLTKIIIKIVKFLEKKAFKSCNTLIFVSKSMAQKSIKDYNLNQSNIFVCHPFVNIDLKTTTNDLDALFPKGKKHIVYSGALGEKQNPIELLNLFQSIVRHRDDVICHIFSRGLFFEQLKKLNREKLGVMFHDLVPEKNLFELYLRSNIQIIPQKLGTSKGAIPSKIPNIIASGTPLFLIGDQNSDTADIVRQSGAGYCSGSWDIDNLVKEIGDFLDLSLHNTHENRQKQVSNFIETCFGIDQLANIITISYSL